MSEQFTQDTIQEVENIISTILEFSNGSTNKLEILRLYAKNCKKERRDYFNDGVYRYVVSMLPEDEQGEFSQLPENRKSSDSVFSIKERLPEKEGYIVCKCGKCGGTGIFAMWIENGQAMSTTGTNCYPCNGRGWMYRKNRK